MSETNKKGDIGEAYFALRATEKGYWIGKMPQECPYDFVLDRGNGLERVQVKYRSSKKHGTIQIHTTGNSLSSSRSYTGAVDQFAVYNPETNNVYLIPAEKVLKGSVSIFRVEPSKAINKNITYLSEFIDW